MVAGTPDVMCVNQGQEIPRTTVKQGQSQCHSILKAVITIEGTDLTRLDLDSKLMQADLQCHPLFILIWTFKLMEKRRLKLLKNKQ